MSGFRAGDVLRRTIGDSTGCTRIVVDAERFARIWPDGSVSRDRFDRCEQMAFLRRCTPDEWARIAAAVEGVPPVLPEHDEPPAAAGRVVAKYAVGDRVRAPSGLATVTGITYTIRYDDCSEDGDGYEDGDHEDVGGYDDEDLSPAPADDWRRVMTDALPSLPPALRKRAEAVLSAKEVA